MTNKLTMPINFFKEFSTIPHASYNEKEIGDYLIKFALNRDLDVKRDDAGNVYIRKAANGEKNAPIILQAHMDMVAAKEEGYDFDFAKDSLKIYEEDGFLHAKGTTLGADNGIGVAMILAVLDNDEIKQPGIEAIITVQEEVGLLGAGKVDGQWFQGKTLINLDSEEEGIFTVSCCGGVRQIIKLPITKTANPYDNTYNIKLEGLLGGHSGMEIDKQRANALQLMARIAHELSPCAIAEFSGGVAMNAIAKDAMMTISSNEDIREKIALIGNKLKKEFSVSDPNLEIKVKTVETPKEVYSEETSNKLITLLLNLPFGVVTMSPAIKDLVQTSSNIGVVKVEENKLLIESSHRSSLASEKELLKQKSALLAKLAGAEYDSQGEYTAWEYREDSAIREIFKQKYQQQSGKEAKVNAIHAGLECGILQEQIGELDMISIGPNIYDVHTPNEKLDIASAERTYELLLNVLAELAK